MIVQAPAIKLRGGSNDLPTSMWRGPVGVDGCEAGQRS